MSTEQQRKWSIGEYVYSPAAEMGGMFVEDNGDGTSAVSTGAVVMTVPTAGLLNEKEYTQYREERRRNSLTWDELKQ